MQSGEVHDIIQPIKWGKPKIKSVNESFVDPSDYSGLAGMTYFTKVLLHLIFFEFDIGWVTYRHLTTTLESEAVFKPLCTKPELVRVALAKELFGGCDQSGIVLRFPDILVIH